MARIGSWTVLVCSVCVHGASFAVEFSVLVHLQCYAMSDVFGAYRLLVLVNVICGVCRALQQTKHLHGYVKYFVMPFAVAISVSNWCVCVRVCVCVG